jgi:hypothetical protein
MTPFEIIGQSQLAARLMHTTVVPTPSYITQRSSVLLWLSSDYCVALTSIHKTYSIVKFGYKFYKSFALLYRY